MVPTPPVLFMTADGKLLGEISNYASAQQVLDKMLAVLEANPDWNQPSAEESEITEPVAKAWVLYDLVKYADAKKVLKDVPGDRAAFLRAHIARRDADWKTMDAELATIEDEALAADVRMERAHKLWHAQDDKAIEALLTDFPEDSGRYTEARYFLGLARYHQGAKDEAIAIWKTTIEACAQDPWIYRADWAYSNAKTTGKGPRVYSTRGPKTSLLDRHGYMGNANPDLARESKSSPATNAK